MIIDVLKMLLSKDKITEDIVDMLMKWRHSGFNVFCGPKILPGEEKAMKNKRRTSMFWSLMKNLSFCYVPTATIWNV